ncbi:MAG: flagellar basal-body rod protein FlgF [Gammaproteobacteria bacterium]|nr:flagellar basal-body rod protein FlgF [Gammaproteobacteria bacterium]
MDRMLYIGMSGAKEVMISQGMNSNNLANVSTTGFREDLAQQRSMSVFGPGLPTRAFAMTEKPGINFEPGPVESTGRPLDMSIQQDGFFAVQAKDGTEAYTRAGDFRTTPQGLLVTGSGLPVMGNAGPISIPPYETLTIGADGTITIRPVGQAAAQLAQIDRVRLVNPNISDLEKGRDGLFRQKNNQPALANADVKIMPGTLERSNVSVVEAMAKMISLTRSFDMQVKVMSTAEEVDKSTDALMKMS